MKPSKKPRKYVSVFENCMYIIKLKNKEEQKWFRTDNLFIC